MALSNQLSREDVMFVAGETDCVYQHVAGLIVLDSSGKPDFDFDYFRQHCIDRVALIPHFRWKLHTVPFGLDRPYWVEDELFSFDHHIKRIAVPAPGDHAALCEVAAHLYSKHLDRSRPLWEIWLIEGLAGGKHAYLQKFHHCMMDGEGALKMLEAISDFEPEPVAIKTIDASISQARAGKPPPLSRRNFTAWSHLVRLPGDAARGLYDLMRPRILEQFVWPRRARDEHPDVPTACFNGAICSDRALTTVALPMADLKAVKSHFGVSLNDVVLALVSSAIRAYLLHRDELPEDSLRTNIPVSLRTSEDDQLSNKVTNTTVTLATAIASPAQRLKAIHAEAEQAKTRAHRQSMGVIEVFQMMPPVLVSTLMGSLPEDQAPQLLGANLIVSNVHGSPIPMYIAGCRMEKMFPMSILTAGIGINVTCISYVDHMDFGIMVDPQLAPGYPLISDGLESALKEYLALCKPAKNRPRRQAATKAKRKVRATRKRRAGDPVVTEKAAAKAKATTKAKAKAKGKVKAKTEARSRKTRKATVRASKNGNKNATPTGKPTRPRPGS